MTAAITDRTITDRTVIDRDATAEVDKYRYHYTRVVETAGRVVRVRVERGSRPSQCHAVAEVLADTMTWTHLTHEVPTHWIDETQPPSLIIHAATELGPVADRLVHRAADILAPSTTSSPPDVPETVLETVVRRFTENGCEVTAVVVADPPLLNDDAHHTLYGTVTRNGVLVGSYYCADRLRQADWRVVTAEGHHVSLDSPPTNPVSESVAVAVLTTEHNRHAIDRHRSPRYDR